MAQVARDLGIADHLLYRWRVEQRQADSQGHTREAMRTEQDELVRRREHVTLEQERDCLQRAAAFFAKESQCDIARSTSTTVASQSA